MYNSLIFQACKENKFSHCRLNGASVTKTSKKQTRESLKSRSQ